MLQNLWVPYLSYGVPFALYHDSATHGYYTAILATNSSIKSQATVLISFPQSSRNLLNLLDVSNP